jgi:predicted small lipoprotein YifL
MTLRKLIILLFVGALTAPALAACGKKAPLDAPTPRQHKEKPAEQ